MHSSPGPYSQGDGESRKIVEDYELFDSRGALKTHVVLATYEAVAGNARVFRKVDRWDCLVVDEGQRLKAGPDSQLYGAIASLRVAQRVLLTGTPLNNNIKERKSSNSFSYRLHVKSARAHLTTPRRTVFNLLAFISALGFLSRRFFSWQLAHSRMQTRTSMTTSTSSCRSMPSSRQSASRRFAACSSLISCAAPRRRRSICRRSCVLFRPPSRCAALTFLYRPQIEVVVPVSMTVLQRGLYRSILERNAAAIRSIVQSSSSRAKPTKGKKTGSFVCVAL